MEDLLIMDYPPRIVMTCKPRAQNPKPLKLDVEGFNRKCTFFIEGNRLLV